MLYLETSSQTFGVPIIFGCWKEVLVINLLSTQETTSINSRKSPSQSGNGFNDVLQFDMATSLVPRETSKGNRNAPYLF